MSAAPPLSPATLASLLESISDAVFALDPQWRFTYANQAASRFARLSREELIGSVIWDLYPDLRSTSFNTAVTRAMMERETVRFELHYEPFSITVEATAYPAEEGITIIARDVTGQRGDDRLELDAYLTEERRIARDTDRVARRLEQTQRVESLGRVAAAMAHEINNILMGIQPMADYIERTATEPAMLSVAAQIARAMERGKRVTEQILRFTRPATPLLAPIEMGSLVSRIAGETATTAGSDIDYSITVPGVPVRVTGDAAQLEQVLRNVLTNARDAMPDGGVLDITLRSAGPDPPVDLPDGRWAEVAISDTGHGMEQETLFRIFEPFFTTRGEAGTGLGLAVAHQIVTAHGGILHAASRPGEGTTFSIFLPMLEEEAIPAAAPKIAGDAREILLIEDDADVAEGLRMLLELEGKEVRIAGTAAEGLAMLREKTPSVVVLDVGLPDMEGTILFDKLREIVPDLPVIFSTGHSDAGRLARHRTEPKVGSLLKPYGIDELLKAIEKVV